VTATTDKCPSHARPKYLKYLETVTRAFFLRFNRSVEHAWEISTRWGPGRAGTWLRHSAAISLQLPFAV
jgi:hypothetical protein